MRILKTALAGLLPVMVGVLAGFAQVPRTISCQGVLTDVHGRAVTDTTTFTFNLYRLQTAAFTSLKKTTLIK